VVNMGKSSVTICVPFGTETMENDPCAVGTARNYTAGTGGRQNTSAQAKERNRQAFQRHAWGLEDDRLDKIERSRPVGVNDKAPPLGTAGRGAVHARTIYDSKVL